jgi:hypothetical protein
VLPLKFEVPAIFFSSISTELNRTTDNTTTSWSTTLTQLFEAQILPIEVLISLWDGNQALRSVTGFLAPQNQLIPAAWASLTALYVTRMSALRISLAN